MLRVLGAWGCGRALVPLALSFFLAGEGAQGGSDFGGFWEGAAGVAHPSWGLPGLPLGMPDQGKC